MVRVTVNLPEAAAAVPEIKQRMLDAGCTAPLIGDFHYNGHLLLTRYPGLRGGARQVPHQPGQRRHRQAARRAVRHHLQGGDRPRQAGPHRRQRRLAQPGAGRRQDAGEHRPQSGPDLRGDPQRVHGDLGASSPRRWRSRPGLRKDQIIISCKVSRPRDLHRRSTATWRARPISRCTSGSPRPAWARRGWCGRRRRWAILLNEGIGDTIRVSLTPRPGGDRREEVYAACELLQALGLRSFSPSVTACPGCGRTTSSTFQELAERTQDYIREQMPEWKTQLRRRRNADARGHGLRRQRARANRRPPTSASACRAPAKRPTARSTSTASTSPRCAAPTRSWPRASARSSTTTSRRGTQSARRTRASGVINADRRVREMSPVSDPRCRGARMHEATITSALECLRALVIAASCRPHAGLRPAHRRIRGLRSQWL